MPSVSTYTVPGYTPRLTSDSAHGNIDICYNIWCPDGPPKDSSPPSSAAPPPADSRFSLIFSHGSQMCKESWNYFIELLFDHYGSQLAIVIAPDAVHSGDSARLNVDKIGWRQHWQDLARDSIEVIRHVRKRYAGTGGDSGLGALVAVGHSMGGAQTLFMANLEPALFAGIILMDPVWGADNSFALGSARQYIGWLTSRILKNAQDTFESKEEYLAFMNKFFMSKDFHPRVKRDMESHSFYVDEPHIKFKASRLMRASAYVGALSAAGHSITSFKQIQVPALVMHGDFDDWNGEGSNEKLAEQLPLGEHVVIPGGGHIVFYQKPGETVSAMIPFIDKILAGLEQSEYEPSLDLFIEKLQKL